MRALARVWLFAAVARWAIAGSAECSASNPCAQGCCGPLGICGFGPDFCGQGCLGTCEEAPECGRFAPEGQELCPLNACCSEAGFCGTTDAFCGTGCQNGCDAPSPPTCGPRSNTSFLKTVGYYGRWAASREGVEGCTRRPQNVHLDFVSHINFAFAAIGEDNRISMMDSNDIELYKEAISRKNQRTGVEVYIAVGGDDASGAMFSSMAATEASRAVFIQSTIEFMDTFDFNGVDLNWDNPAAADTANYVALVREFRAALVLRFGLTVAIPINYPQVRHFDLSKMATYVDWFNVKTYDLHGSWGEHGEWTGDGIRPHTSIPEIDDKLSILWRAGVNPRQVVMGVSLYGRSYTLSDPTCTHPGCPFSGVGNPGSCTKTPGTLSNAEIFDIMREKSLASVTDKYAGVQYATWDDQWVSYDDEITVRYKRSFANYRCLGGMMVWALDLDNNLQSTLRSLAGYKSIPEAGRPNVPGGNQNLAWPMRHIVDEYSLMMHLLLTDCGADSCPPGYKSLTTNYGAWAHADTYHEACPPTSEGTPQSRRLCVEDDLMITGCHWLGLGLKCSDGCPKGSIQLATNTAPGPGIVNRGFVDPDLPRYCAPGHLASFCCTNLVMKPRLLQRCDVSTPGSFFVSGRLAGSLVKATVNKAMRAAELKESIDGLAEALGLDEDGVSTNQGESPSEDSNIIQKAWGRRLNRFAPSTECELSMRAGVHVDPQSRQAQLFYGLHRGMFRETDISPACDEALNMTLVCPREVSRLVHPDFFLHHGNNAYNRKGWDRKLIEELCKPRCRDDITSLASRLSASCQSERFSSQLGNMSFVEYGELIEYRTSVLCLRENGSSGDFCHLAQNDWDITALENPTWPQNPQKCVLAGSGKCAPPVVDTELYDEWDDEDSLMREVPDWMYPQKDYRAYDYDMDRTGAVEAVKWHSYGSEKVLNWDQYPLEIQCQPCFWKLFVMGHESRWGHMPWDEVTEQIWANIVRNCELTAADAAVWPHSNHTGYYYNSSIPGKEPDKGPDIDWHSCPAVAVLSHDELEPWAWSAVQDLAREKSLSMTALHILNNHLNWYYEGDQKLCLPLSCPVKATEDRLTNIQDLILNGKLGDMTEEQFLRWNKHMTMDTFFFPKDTVCVGPHNGIYEPPLASPVGDSAYSATATPREDAPPIHDTIPNCALYHVVEDGDTCALLSLRYSVTFSQMINMNPSIDPACSNLESGYSYCMVPVHGTDVPTAVTSRPVPIGELDL